MLSTVSLTAAVFGIMAIAEPVARFMVATGFAVLFGA